MKERNMIEEIIELLPSANLKARLKETKHHFEENELLQIIYRYAPTLREKLELLSRFTEIASSEIAAWARMYMEHEQDKFRAFSELSDGYVYELCIKETPYSVEERYICSSYSSALVCIDRFYEEYADVDCKETEQSRYRIFKRKIFTENDMLENDAFENDIYSECLLGANKTVLEVSDYVNRCDCGLDILCSECKKLCPWRVEELRFPSFTRDYDIIRYYDYYGKEYFGVNIGFEEELLSDIYVIPLDTPMIDGYTRNDYLCHHCHIELPLATVASPENLDEATRRRYFKLIEILKSKEK